MWVNALAVLLLAAPPAALAPATRMAACGPVVTQGLAEAPWPLARLRPDLAWPLSTGAGVTVAVIDSGVSSDHPTLSGKVLPGNDFVTPGPGGCDENGHGTLIAGIIAGREHSSNGFVFHGIAPNASVVPVRVLRDQSRSFDRDMPARIAAALRWAVDQGGAQVVNLSLSTTDDPQLASTVKYALDKGVVLVAAAGNESATQGPAYPAAYDGVLGVAAVDRQDKHSDTSTTGPYVDLAAPGKQIAGPSPAGGGYLYSEPGGTSFASAYVSGVAALLRAYEPSLTPKEVGRRLMDTADHPAGIWNPAVGYGVVNPQRAVGALQLNQAGTTALARVRPVAPPGDPLAEVTSVATIVAISGTATVLVILFGAAAWRRGRRRGWRPSRRRVDPVTPAPTPE
ncbi:MAG TPA: type VII secretion-associated serine protease mycosin [Candidatus Limnocylindrales bacterium]|nr:type VII secretion-associated serine protease mycosin [Candidatus Limnocylindrales bacterium]